MKELIFIDGPPGIGKTTISKILQKELNYSPLIDLDWVRGYHLDPQWKKANEKEKAMSFKNLIYTIKNYLKNKYKNILVVGLGEELIRKTISQTKVKNYLIVTLTINENKELKARVLNKKRDSGFRKFEESAKYNALLKKRKLIKNEFKIDNSHNNVHLTVKKITSLINF